MKWYRKAALVSFAGAVCGTIYGKCKRDEQLRKTVLQFAGASLAYSSVAFLTTAFIPRLRYACYYVTLTSFVTSANFLFTRQFLLEKEWLCRKQDATRADSYKISALSGAQTGLVLEGILTEGSVLSTLRSSGFWALVALGLQLLWFLVEDWRVRRTLSLHRPDLYPPQKLDIPGRSFRMLEKVMLGEWKIDKLNHENNRLDILLVRELDRVRQIEQALEDSGVPYKVNRP